MTDLNIFFQSFYQQLVASSPIELIGVLFGILQVWFAKANKSIHYLFGLLSITLTLFILFEVKLYAEIILNLYYFVMSIYGWWYWFKKPAANSNGQQPIAYASRIEWATVAAICVVGYFLLYTVLQNFTDSDVPAADAFVASFAWAGMWLLARRRMENWILLNISNFVAIPLLYHKGLVIYTLLTIFLFVMAIFGYLNWRKIIRGKAYIFSKD